MRHTIQISGYDEPRPRSRSRDKHVRYVVISIDGGQPMELHWTKAIQIGAALYNAAELMKPRPVSQSWTRASKGRR